MKDLSLSRRVRWLSLEGGLYPYPENRAYPSHLLGLSRLEDGTLSSKLLALFDGHGRWIDWIAG